MPKITKTRCKGTYKTEVVNYLIAKLSVIAIKFYPKYTGLSCPSIDGCNDHKYIGRRR